ncbi:hypothetical protein SDJN03_18409, partial [Cucurbita argyrosperma subsp. sororia]
MHLGVWQEQVSDVLIQPGLHKALKGRLSGDTSEKLSIDSSPLAGLAKKSWPSLKTIKENTTEAVVAAVHEGKNKRRRWKSLSLMPSSGIQKWLLCQGCSVAREETACVLRVGENGGKGIRWFFIGGSIVISQSQKSNYQRCLDNG